MPPSPWRLFRLGPRRRQAARRREGRIEVEVGPVLQARASEAKGATSVRLFRLGCQSEIGREASTASRLCGLRAGREWVSWVSTASGKDGRKRREECRPDAWRVIGARSKQHVAASMAAEPLVQERESLFSRGVRRRRGDSVDNTGRILGQTTGTEGDSAPWCIGTEVCVWAEAKGVRTWLEGAGPP